MNIDKIILTPKHHLLILLFIAVGLNINTLFNEYVLDDRIVMTENSFVEKGIKGIPEIFSNDYLGGIFTAENQIVAKPLYRPLSIVVFAIEHQFFGENPFISHLINVLFFAFLISLLYRLLQTYIFNKQNDLLAFASCLLFAVHPIHTEVIANVKSRDELMAFILLILALISFIKHTRNRSITHFISGIIYFFLALLTKESAVTFIGLVPLVMYFFFNQTIKKFFLFTIPLILSFVAYMLIRLMAIGLKAPTLFDIQNFPFLLASASQAFATKTFILVKYICKLFYPHPLSWDYGYNQIPYVEIFSVKFLFSLLIIISLMLFAIYTFKRKSLFTFCILYFFISISIASNFIVEMVTPFSERLLFQPSLAFCIALGFSYTKIKSRSMILANSILITILILFSIKSFIRNGEWRNYETLMLTDVISAPNSLKTNMSALELYDLKANAETNPELKNEYYKKAVYYGEQCLKIYSSHPTVYMNLGSAYFGLHDYYKTAQLWQKAYQLIPDDPEVKKSLEFLSTTFYKQGNGFSESGATDSAIKNYLKATELNNNNVEAWYNLGGSYYLKKDTISAYHSWGKVKQLDPKHQIKKEDFRNK